ncbi:MAG TPA: hypothetical protein VJG32_18980 [Anaerolineae bacterium]|nr:hypothetical protein [Anaerolineae bacterium]
MATGDSLRTEGLRLYRESRYEDAAQKFAEAQSAFSAQGGARDAAESANNCGVCWRQAARWAEAHAAFDAARAAFHALGDVAGEGQVIGNLGALADSEGQPAQAIEYYTEAIALLESAGEKDLAQATYTALSRLKMRQGNWLGALDAYEGGLAQVDRPSMMQRVLRRFLNVPRKLSGGS